jgi:hypothetical protein
MAHITERRKGHIEDRASNDKSDVLGQMCFNERTRTQKKNTGIF